MPSHDPIADRLARQAVLILDGGLATELETRGFDLRDELWSARLLLENPGAIRQLYLDYLEAGADVVTSASYQATFEGFARRGLGREEAAELLRFSVELAREARATFWKEPTNRGDRVEPLLLASVGPYGAYLADGSEYRGDYGLDVVALMDFHRPRWRVLAASGADLLACETIPSRVETRALRRLFDEHPETRGWISFQCRDGARLADGSELEAAVAELDGCDGVVAVGVNCVAPRHVTELVERLRRVTDRPIAVYPNSGEVYDPVEKRWLDAATPVDLGARSAEWLAAGARLIGGCCRTGPEHVRQIRRRLLPAGS